MDHAGQEPPHEHEQGRTELHFQRGFMGWLARRFLALEKQGDPYEETVILPALVSIGVLLAGEQQALSELATKILVMASGILAGARLGTVWGGTRTFRVVLRSISVGLLISAGMAVFTTTMSGPEELSARSGTVAGMMLLTFWFGHTVTGLLRGIVLISEEQWQRGVPRRAWIGRVSGIAVGTEKPEGATKTQALTAHVLRKTGAAIGKFVGTAITAFIAGRVIFGMRLEDWLDLLKG